MGKGATFYDAPKAPSSSATYTLFLRAGMHGCFGHRSCWTNCVMLVYNLPTKPKLVTRKYRRLPMQVFSMNAPTFLFHLTLVLFEHGI